MLASRSTRGKRRLEPWLSWAGALATLAPCALMASLATARAQDDDPPTREAIVHAPTYGRPALTAPPRIHPEDPHRLAVGDEVFFPVGHYGGSITATSRAWGGDVWAMNREFLDALARHGLNYARAWVYWGGLPTGRDDWNASTVHPWARVVPPAGSEARAPAIDGEPPFDLERFDPRHFELVARTLDYARERGIVLQLVVFDCWHLQDRAGGGGESPSGIAYDALHPRNNANGVAVTTPEQWLDPSGPAFAVHTRYVRELVRRVGDRPNLIWEACNENPLTAAGRRPTAPAAGQNGVGAPAFDLAVAELLTATERELGLAPHLVMPRDLPDHRRVAGHFTPARDRAQLEESLGEMRSRLAGEQWAWNQPLISDNDCCRDRGEPAFRRRKLWTALSAGAHVDFFVAGLPHDRALLESADVGRGLAFFGQVFRFFAGAGVDLVGMGPCPARGDGWALCRAGAAPGPPGGPAGAAGARDAGAAEWIAYLPHGGGIRLDGLPAERHACWFDPREGTFRAGTGGPVYHAPGARDWVLHVRAGQGRCGAPP
jgi:hypothetical protein